GAGLALRRRVAVEHLRKLVAVSGRLRDFVCKLHLPARSCLMDHALTLAVAAGIVGLILLSALLLRQGSRMLGSLEAIRSEHVARSPMAAPAAGAPSTMLRASAMSHRPQAEDASTNDIFVPVPAFDAEGNPSPKRIPLELLLKGVGI